MLIITDPKLIRPTGAAEAPIRVAEVISALSFALDLTEGQPMGHSVRACVFGMRLAEEIGVPVALRSDLYYALLMKDAGCSSNASRMVQILGTDDIKAKAGCENHRLDESRLGVAAICALARPDGRAVSGTGARAFRAWQSIKRANAKTFSANPLREGIGDCTAHRIFRSTQPRRSTVWTNCGTERASRTGLAEKISLCFRAS